MLKKMLFSLALLALTLATVVPAVAADTSSYVGQIVKVENRSTLYYVAADGKKYIFPNEKIYNTWFTGFKDVKTLTPEEFDAIPLGGNVMYRPGIVLVKSTDNPNVFAVGKDGLLRWIKNEIIAKKLYGENWNKLIDDMPGSLISQYKIGASINDSDEFDPDSEADNAKSIDENRGLAWGLKTRLAETVRCRVIEHVAQKFDEKHGRSGPFVKLVERFCDRSDNNDTTAPVINNLNASPSTTSAVVAWNTNEASTSRIYFATDSLETTSSTSSAFNNTLVTSHSLSLTGLSASTTYYYYIESADASNNMATSSEHTFKTLAAPSDVTPPVISSINVNASTTSAIITWHTDESSNSRVRYADESLATAATINTVFDSDFVLPDEHLISLSGLNSSTTYYFLVESTDASGNSATSSEQMFNTL